MSVGANRLRKLRKLSGKSQTLVGDFNNISQSRMSDYEQGGVIPSDAAKSLAKYFGVTTDYLLCMSDDTANIQCTNITEDEYSRLMFMRSLTEEQRILVDAILKTVCTVTSEKR